MVGIHGTWMHTCRHECPAHPLNNCQGLRCEKRLGCCHVSPEPEMETGTAKQPAGCICYASLTHIHRAWITLYLHYSPPVAALYMCSTLSTTDLPCLHSVPSKSCPCIEDCCSGASKTLYSKWWIQNRWIRLSVLSPQFDEFLECLFSHSAMYDTMNWTQEDSLVLL